MSRLAQSRSSRLALTLLLAALALASCRRVTVTGIDMERGSDAARSSMPTGDDHATLSAAYALTASNALVKIDLADPKKVQSRVSVSGLDAGVDLLGIDFRSANGALYALGSNSRLYTIDVNTGAATAVGVAPFAPALSGMAFGFDFNPTVDRIRVVSNTGQNLRLHPDTGALAAMDSMIAYTGTDANAGSTPRVTAVAYTNPDNNPMTATTLYDIDAVLDLLTTQAPPNNGRLNTVGALGAGADDLAGFDITLVGSSNVAYLATGSTAKGAQRNRLYQVDLTTGATTNLGRIGHGETITGLAIPTQP